MPFTLSHAAIVLPFDNLKRKVFSLTGLVAGSMAPDFEFLFRLRETDCFAHTWLGIIMFSIPFSIVSAFVFHSVIRNPLILHLPAATRKRCTSFLYFDFKKYFIRNIVRFMMSVLLGIGSHIFLDAFTHADGIFVLGNSFFNNEFIVMQHRIPVYTVLQFLSSIIGLVYIGWFISRMKKGADTGTPQDFYTYWISLVLVGLLLFAIRLYAYPQFRSPDDIIAALVGSFVYSVLIISVYYTNYKIKRKEIKKALR